jgi:hypothetical protein
VASPVDFDGLQPGSQREEKLRGAAVREVWTVVAEVVAAVVLGHRMGLAEHTAVRLATRDPGQSWYAFLLTTPLPAEVEAGTECQASVHIDSDYRMTER